MESFLNVYENLKQIDNIEQIAYERLFENYLKLNLKGPKKLIDIDSTDNESNLFKTFSSQPGIPGKIYTFINLNEKNLDQLQNVKNGKIIEFHDFTPILFCTSYDVINRIIKGLNLNMLPPIERLKFIEAYYQYFKPYMSKVESIKNVQWNIDYNVLSAKGENSILIKNFNTQFNSRFDFSYRSYKLHNLKIFRMLEYEEWQYIPFFNAKNSFKSISLNRIYQTYIDNKNKT